MQQAKVALYKNIYIYFFWNNEQCAKNKFIQRRQTAGANQENISYLLLLINLSFYQYFKENKIFELESSVRESGLHDQKRIIYLFHPGGEDENVNVRTIQYMNKYCMELEGEFKKKKKKKKYVGSVYHLLSNLLSYQ